MKSAIAILFACLVASSAAFAPTMMVFKKASAEPELASKSKPSKGNFIYDDGLTDIERKQRKTQPNFLTGSAKSQADPSTVREDLFDVGNSWSLTPQQTLIANCAALLVLLSIINAIKY